MESSGYGAFGVPNFNVCIDARTSYITSKLYIPIDTGLIIADKYNEISNKQMCKFNAILGES